jgi:UDP-N-acetylmuramoylalanine--D-glutamate ligase
MFTKTISKLNHKSILIIGMAREGLSTAEFLLKHLDDALLSVTDTKSLDQLDSKWTSLLETRQELSHLETEQVKGKTFDYIFKSPGIPQRILEENYQLNLEQTIITSNTQLFFDIIESYEESSVTIGITGTKGKTTTTSQIFHVLKQAQLPVVLGGNIGVPPLEMLENNSNIHRTIYVIELSCHQLAELSASPKIAVIQDISPDHLDYYPDFETYFEAKTAICKFQNKASTVIYNADSKTATKMAQLSEGIKIPFSLENEELVTFIKNSHSPLVGKHNLYNTIPAVLVGRQLGITEEQVSKGIETFKPVSHRLELVKIVAGVKFYNDSAASTPEATIAAIKAFEQTPLVLIVGGSEKGVNFDGLAQQIIKSKVKYLVLFPTTGEKVLESIKKIDDQHPLLTNQKTANSMVEAIQISVEHSTNGDTVLLSPASASFNMFKSYEDRGNQFKELVNNL